MQGDGVVIADGAAAWRRLMGPLQQRRGSLEIFVAIEQDPAKRVHHGRLCRRQLERPLAMRKGTRVTGMMIEPSEVVPDEGGWTRQSLQPGERYPRRGANQFQSSDGSQRRPVVRQKVREVTCGMRADAGNDIVEGGPGRITGNPEGDGERNGRGPGFLIQIAAAAAEVAIAHQLTPATSTTIYSYIAMGNRGAVVVDPFVGAFRLLLVIAAVAALWNGAGWGVIIVAAVLYFLLVPFLR